MVYEAIARSEIVPLRSNAARERHDDRRIDLKELLSILSRRRRWIVWTAALFLAAALGYGLVARALYTATAQILVDPREQHVVANDVTPTSLPADGGIAQVESQLKVIASDNVLFRVIAKEGLASDPEFGGESDRWISVLKRDAERLLGLGSQQEAPDLKALRILKKQMTVRRADKVFVIDVSVSSESRDKAVRIANAVVEAYLQDQADARGDASRRASNALSSRLAELRKRVETAETRVEAYKSAHNIVGAGRAPRQRAAAERDQQPARRGAGPDRGSEGALRPGPRAATHRPRERRHRRSARLADDHAAQGAGIRDRPAGSGPQDPARAAPSRDRRRRGAVSQRAAPDRRRTSPRRRFLAQRLRACPRQRGLARGELRRAQEGRDANGRGFRAVARARARGRREPGRVRGVPDPRPGDERAGDDQHHKRPHHQPGDPRRSTKAGLRARCWRRPGSWRASGSASALPSAASTSIRRSGPGSASRLRPGSRFSR